MRKSFVIAAFVAVAGIAVSCAKSTPTNHLSEPRAFTLSAEMPQLETTTKMELSGNEAHWQNGDAIRLIVQDAMPATSNAEGTGWTDCGNFTTSTSGSKSATFSGTLPAGAVGDQYGLAVFPANYVVPGGIGLTKITDGQFYMYVQVNIPAVQDGTGMRYMQGIAKLKNGSLTNFAWTSAMYKVTVPSGKDVTKIVVSRPDTKQGAETTAKSLACDHQLYYKNDTGEVTKVTTSQKGVNSFSVTVTNGGAELSGDQYITIRPGEANIPHTLTFYNSSDAVIKAFAFTTPTSVSSGKIYNLGDFTSKL